MQGCCSADCGAKLHFCAAKSLKPNQEFYRCANYKDGRGSCQIHYIRNVVLEQIVLTEISELADFVRCYEPVFLYLLSRKTETEKKAEFNAMRQRLTTARSRISEIEQKLRDADKACVDLRMLLKGLREYTEIKELTPELINTLIQRIKVHNSDRSEGRITVKVEIYFTAAGMIDLPTEKELEKLIAEFQKEHPKVTA